MNLRIDNPKMASENNNDDTISSGRKRARSRRITIEPVMFLAMIGYGTVGTIRTQYVRYRVAMDYNVNTTDESNSSCFLNESSPQYQLEQEIQSKAATITLLLTLCSLLPPIFSAILIGTWSDNHRRKFALFCPVLGMTIQSAIYLFITLFELPLTVAFAAELIQGITGSFPLLLSASLAYIADVTDKDKRMIRIVIVDLCVLIAVGGSQVAVGFLIESTGYATPLYFIVSFLLLDLLYIALGLIETIERSTEQNSFRTGIKDIIREIHFLFKNNTNNRRSRLITLGSTTFVNILLITGYLSTVVIFALDDPFCWTPDIVGIFIAISLVVGALGLAIGAKLFSLCLNDFWIIQIGNFSLLFTMLSVSFANSTPAIFISSLGGCLRILAPPVMRAMMSKTVDDKEQGVMFSFQTSCEGVAMFAAPLILQSIYAATVQIDQHICFYVASAICIIPISLTALLQFKAYKESKSYDRLMHIPGEKTPVIGSIN